MKKRVQKKVESVPPMVIEESKSQDKTEVPATSCLTTHSDIPYQVNERIEVSKNSTLKLIIHIVINGGHDKNFKQTIHSGLISKMLQAQRQNDTPLFLTTLQSYLEQAVMHIAQAGRREDVPKHMDEIRRLIEVAGLSEVSLPIVRAATASI
jgi:hypothetical protein